MHPNKQSINHRVLRAATAIHTRRTDLLEQVQGDPVQGHKNERGEGIVSVAIAVLIMAALGVVAYGAFDTLFNNTTNAAESQISSIGG